ncbi:SLBB domain-containing protein [Halalkalibaculum sp. DA384]|uniref:SLBB domain-containing protein n=1 Tax=Halalkalibaculum sp. DA384 TaxID=3373606 RepID=UPI0037545088
MVANYKLFSVGLFLVSFLFIAVCGVVAQDIGSVDFQNLRSSDLSDQQIQQLWERAQNQGYSISQLEQMALARGMQPAEVSRLVSRLRDIRMQRSQEDARQVSSPQLRTVTTDTSQVEEQQRTRRDTIETRIFGANLFRSDKITFTPSLNIPTPEDYQLGPGDEIVIDIWGAAEQTYQLTVSPEGTITVANLGPIYLNGLSIQDARERIRSALTKIYSGLEASEGEPTDTQARISLGNIRSINVTVLGEARFPGTYTLPSLATVFNALYSAGGPDSTGTFREIEVIRGDSVAATLDIYDFLVYGDQSDNIRLRDQDIIKIDPYLSRVELKGKTKRTGFFELKEEETVQDLITFAGGFSENAYTKRIKVVSNTESQKRIDDIEYPGQRNFRPGDGAEVTVGKVLERFENRVEIQGAVFRPGDYELQDTSTVYSLIRRAEGIREDAFMNRGLIYREQTDLTIEAIPFSVREVLNNPEQNDIRLQRNDIVQISSIFDLREDYTINVVGAVQEPGSFPYVENMTLEDVILQADGFKESAAPYRIEVSRRIDGGDSTFVPREIAEIHQFRVDEDLKLDAETADFTLQPFDKVFVRNSPSYFEQEEVTIEGEVLFPGKYTLDQKYMRISDLIQRAGGLTQYAYPQGANLTRQVEQKVDTTFLNIPDSLQDASSLQQNTTRVGIQLGEIMKNPGVQGDLILQAGDVLEIPKELQTVQVAGEVLYPISVRYEKNLSFKQYLRAAGGASELGKPKDAYIVYANGEVDRARNILFFRDYPKVRPGATIYVPPKEQQRQLTAQERISIFSAIVSMAAIVSNTIFQITRN